MFEVPDTLFHEATSETKATTSGEFWVALSRPVETGCALPTELNVAAWYRGEGIGARGIYTKDTREEEPARSLARAGSGQRRERH